MGYYWIMGDKIKLTKDEFKVLSVIEGKNYNDFLKLLIKNFKEVREDEKRISIAKGQDEPK
jgi:hypothetical protein